MAHGKPLANAPYPTARACLPPFAGWMRSVLLATGGVSAGKWRVHALSSARLIVSSGSAPLAIGATVATARNCERRWRPLVAISRPATLSAAAGMPATLAHALDAKLVTKPAISDQK